MLIACRFKGKKGKVSEGLPKERKRLQGSWLASHRWSPSPGTLSATTLRHYDTLPGISLIMDFLGAGQHPPSATRNSLWEAGAVWTNEASIDLSGVTSSWAGPVPAFLEA